MNDYWENTVIAALEEAGLSATNEQIEKMAHVIEGAHEVHGEYTGQHLIPNPESVRADRLLAALKREQSMFRCRKCGGTGYSDIPVGASHWSTEVCSHCNGKGRHLP